VAVATCRGDIDIVGQDRYGLDEAIVKKSERITRFGRLLCIDVEQRHRREAMRAARFGAVIGILGALIAAPAVSAGPSTITTISIHVVFGGDETFTTTGGVLCPSGTAISDPFFQTFGGRMNRGVFTFHLVKTLTCDDGSGSFKLLVDAASTPNSPGTIGGFAIGGGTGDYVGVHGGGSLVGTAFDAGLDDLYTGRVTIAP
jgi:hypothetical protein